MVGYFSILTEFIQIDRVLSMILYYFILDSVSNIGLLLSKNQKVQNWCIVIRCITITLLLMIGICTAIIIGSGRFPELMSMIGAHVSLFFWGLFAFALDKIYIVKKGI